mmetsp:Transcript_14255/g.44832  ORF Transcript_14255/g.44832 Transcript_14255/m.44832 type:complete len:418 (-) Transcript_14255:558-1811(-)
MVGQGHALAGEVEVLQRGVVQPGAVHHPDHPVAQGLGLLGLLHHVGDVRDLLHELGEGLVDARDGVDTVYAREAQVEARGARAVRGCDLVGPEVRGLRQLAADDARLRVELQVPRQRRLHGVGDAEAAGHLRLQEHLLTDGVLVARVGVAQALWPRRGDAKGQDHGRAAGLVRGRDHVGVLRRGAQGGPDDAARGRVERQALGQRRLHRPARGAALDLRLQPHLLAHAVDVVDLGVGQALGRQDLQAEGQRRGRGAGLVAGGHCVGGARRGLRRRPLQRAGAGVQPEARGQRWLHRVPVHFPLHRGPELQGPVHRVLPGLRGVGELRGRGAQHREAQHGLRLALAVPGGHHPRALGRHLRGHAADDAHGGVQVQAGGQRGRHLPLRYETVDLGRERQGLPRVVRRYGVRVAQGRWGL